MTWAGVSLPVSNALYSDAGPLLTMLAGLLTCGVSLLIVGLSIRYFRSVEGIDLVRT